jgi:hypothetical protein
VKPVIFERLLDVGPDLSPRTALGDKGYDSKSNRDAARQRCLIDGSDFAVMVTDGVIGRQLVDS